MTITLIFLAVLLFAFLGWILSRSFGTQPWATEGADIEPDQLPAFLTRPRIGLIVFLAAITSLFALTVSAYAMRMEISGDWIAVPTPPLLWLNTVILIVGSMALHRAWLAAGDPPRPEALRSGLLLAGACTVAFIVGQLVAWRQLTTSGYGFTGNPANSFFYLVTALHAIHVLGGLVAWVRTTRRVWRGGSAADVRSSVELCAWYWHYLLVIWAILFGLLLVT